MCGDQFTAAMTSLTRHRVGSPPAHRFLGESLGSSGDRRSSACWNVGNLDGCQHFNRRAVWPFSRRARARVGVSGRGSAAGRW